MGKLTKAGADARHFLTQFNSVKKMADLLNELSGLEGEVSQLEASKKKLTAERAKIKSALEQETARLVAEQAAVEGVKEATTLMLTTADKKASAILERANHTVAEQAEKELLDLHAAQAEWKTAQEVFTAWEIEALGRSAKLTADNQKLEKALENLRRKFT